MKELLKYKHYLLVIAALVIAKFILTPLWEDVLVRQNELLLKERKVLKTEQLMSARDSLDKYQGQLDIAAFKIHPYLFSVQSDAEFKLQAQGKIEGLLKEHDCNVESIGWEGKTNIEDILARWQLQVRFKGNPECALNVTRKLEEMEPLVRVSQYSFAGREVSGDRSNKMVIMLSLEMWQNVSEVRL
ncbi:hypothetical protein W04_1116 [Pseudoalteromonas sp. SW0106-04]|uniref:hypothetical protein n=1 Tax=Pseudoalteromonas sp. SW0106-04 TaxID=1702169 RepID=UPI0006B5DE21|nr:hypothetical protein [Pseudoalteromonas sp. SW0106-04]GAP74600.1 hypothetical protein W04_1116 [Pseudoalteromonas sp. SW0106-04]